MLADITGNYPPGTWDADPRAPWNEPEPWEGRTCGECRLCRPLRTLDGGLSSACATEGNDDVYEVDPHAPACEGYEEGR